MNRQILLFIGIGLLIVFFINSFETGSLMGNLDYINYGVKDSGGYALYSLSLVTEWANAPCNSPATGSTGHFTVSLPFNPYSTSSEPSFIDNIQENTFFSTTDFDFVGLESHNQGSRSACETSSYSLEYINKTGKCKVSRRDEGGLGNKSIVDCEVSFDLIARDSNGNIVESAPIFGRITGGTLNVKIPKQIAETEQSVSPSITDYTTDAISDISQDVKSPGFIRGIINSIINFFKGFFGGI